jgi:hypothetical protein
MTAFKSIKQARKNSYRKKNDPTKLGSSFRNNSPSERLRFMLIVTKLRVPGSKLIKMMPDHLSNKSRLRIANQNQTAL